MEGKQKVETTEEEKEETMKQLLSMGFSHELSTQALSATSSNSIPVVVNWILSHNQPTPTPKIHKIFQFPKNPTKPSNQQSSSQTKRKRQAPNITSPMVPVDHLSVENKESLLETSNSVKRLTRETAPTEPLFERMRPRDVSEVVGQDHILGTNTFLKSAIECDRLPSIILWGPPGTGKTSIARAICNASLLSPTYRFVSLSVVCSGVKDIREAVEGARKAKLFSKKQTLLFIDEIHRFNRSQQDLFLPMIEDGSVVLIGATTENPSFHLIAPLLSRCKVLRLFPLVPDNIVMLLERAASDSERGLLRSVKGVGSVSEIEVDHVAICFLANHCDGDARVALNALEMSATTAAARLITHKGEAEKHIPVDDNQHVSLAKVTLADAKDALQSKHIAYDKTGEEHYNLISALIKSMRGSDANAAIYWLARMLEGGEEPLYISRRLICFASEDVGLADPLALPQAVACYQSCHFIGMPECSLSLAQCVAYMALAPKSVAVYKAIEAAKQVVRDSVGQNEGVPLHLRNAPNKLMKELGYGEGYIYPPNDPAISQAYLPISLQGYKFLNWSIKEQ